jgi:hypothetical protein
MASVTKTPYSIPDYFIVNINDYILKIIHKIPENLTEKNEHENFQNTKRKYWKKLKYIIYYIPQGGNLTWLIYLHYTPC